MLDIPALSQAVVPLMAYPRPAAHIFVYVFFFPSPIFFSVVRPFLGAYNIFFWLFFFDSLALKIAAFLAVCI